MYLTLTQYPYDLGSYQALQISVSWERVSAIHPIKESPGMQVTSSIDNTVKGLPDFCTLTMAKLNKEGVHMSVCINQLLGVCTSLLCANL
jgi:hypothetical protein